ncbi:hypothetical protein [Mycolicibacterium boenickei]|nr:hypothetical protein [Mycolicibacterium boenickei]
MKPVHDELNERAEKILQNPTAYYAEARELAREEVKKEMEG